MRSRSWLVFRGERRDRFCQWLYGLIARARRRYPIRRTPPVMSPSASSAHVVRPGDAGAAQSERLQPLEEAFGSFVPRGRLIVPALLLVPASLEAVLVPALPAAPP